MYKIGLIEIVSNRADHPMVLVTGPATGSSLPAAARRLLEVPLQQTLQSLAVTGLVAGQLNELGTPGSQGKVLAGLSNFGHLLDKC